MSLPPKVLRFPVQLMARRELEQARGISVGQATMDLLLEAGLIRPYRRALAPGPPTLWATTPKFLLATRSMSVPKR